MIIIISRWIERGLRFQTSLHMTCPKIWTPTVLVVKSPPPNPMFNLNPLSFSLPQLLLPICLSFRTTVHLDFLSFGLTVRTNQRQEASSHVDSSVKQKAGSIWCLIRSRGIWNLRSPILICDSNFLFFLLSLLSASPHTWQDEENGLNSGEISFLHLMYTPWSVFIRSFSSQHVTCHSTWHLLLLLQAPSDSDDISKFVNSLIYFSFFTKKNRSRESSRITVTRSCFMWRRGWIHWIPIWHLRWLWFHLHPIYFLVRMPIHSSTSRVDHYHIPIHLIHSTSISAVRIIKDLNTWFLASLSRERWERLMSSRSYSRLRFCHKRNFSLQLKQIQLSAFVTRQTLRKKWYKKTPAIRIENMGAKI